MYIILRGDDLSHGIISRSWTPIYEEFDGGAVIPLTFKSVSEAKVFMVENYPESDYAIYEEKYVKFHTTEVNR